MDGGPRLCRAKGWETQSSCGSGSTDDMKHVHFAPVAVIYEIPRNDELNEQDQEEELSVAATGIWASSMDPIRRYWWTEDECIRSRSDVWRSVTYYRNHEHEFLQGIAVLANPHSSQEQVDDELEELALMHSSTRGMESHICDVLSTPRKAVLRAVPDQQEGGMTKACSSSKDRLQQDGVGRPEEEVATLCSMNDFHNKGDDDGCNGTTADDSYEALVARIREASGKLAQPNLCFQNGEI